MVIFILGGADDDHAVHMHRYLSTHGCDVEFLDSRDFPTRLQIAYDPSEISGEVTLAGGRAIRISDVQSVYWRSYGGVGGVQLPHDEQTHIAQNDARSLFESLLIDLPCRWVNGWNAFQLHQTKAVQLRRVAQLGAAVPATLLGNDPAAIKEFAKQHGDCIFKPVQGGAHTRRLTSEHLTDENLARLAISPVTIQEEIHGTNIRVFVAGERVMACEVATGDVDFRDDPQPAIRPLELPDPISEQARQIAGALDLLWTGIDYRLTPDGRYLFLEANPSPMFIEFERRTGLPLTESLAHLLTATRMANFGHLR